jgi:hypothetical protein
MYVFGEFLFFVLVHIVMAYFVRCPHCQKCLTVQGFGEPHPSSGGSWSKVVLNWFSGSVICIHCGNSVNTNGL